MRILFILFNIFLILFLFSCTQQKSEDTSMVVTEIKEPDTSSEEGVDWKEISIRDVRTGNDFKISDFKGKPILVESFAVWCPTCTKQQQEIKKLHEDVGDSVVSVSLDTDPNEEESQVKEHTEQNGFDWYYAVSPKDLTQSLIDEFGVGVVNAPQAPVILVCEDLSTRLLDRGVKDTDELKEAIEEGC
jgi:thiol-disulfide isomerase/thioredoxin